MGPRLDLVDLGEGMTRELGRLIRLYPGEGDGQSGWWREVGCRKGGTDGWW